jgi:predicted DNA-binding protein with PD1-like motif
MTERWLLDAESPTDYHNVQYRPGREFILRLNTGADVWLAIQRFAIENQVQFAKLHSAFMGGLQPARFLVWTPDTQDPSNWHHESEMEICNLSMILALGGMIHLRKRDGKEEPFPAIHFVAGGAWNVPTLGGHLLPGSIVKGAFELFVTEVNGIEAVYGPLLGDEFPENWYRPSTG